MREWILVTVITLLQPPAAASFWPAPGTIVKFYGPIKAAGVLEYLHHPYTGDTPACWKSEEILAHPRIPPLKMRETQKKTEIKAGLGGSAPVSSTDRHHADRPPPVPGGRRRRQPAQVPRLRGRAQQQVQSTHSLHWQQGCQLASCQFC